MATYLVDYENVNAGGMSGIEKLDGRDTVLIFYSQQADTLTFSLHKKLMDSPAGVVLVRVEGTSKNSLDFQLSSYLGYLIARDAKAEYVIVSKDNGFAVLGAFWKQIDVKVSLIPGLQAAVPAQPAPAPQPAAPAAAPPAKAPAPVAAQPQQPQPATEDRLQQLLPQYTEELPVIREYLHKYKTKQGFNNALTKTFGSDKTGIIYRAVKPLLVDKKGN